MEVINESDVKEFISRLPDLSIDPPTVHLIMMAIRSRKAKEIFNVKMRDLVIERRIVRASMSYDWRKRYFNKVYNLALLQHHAKYEYGIIHIPLEVKAIYATLSPRNVIRAITEVMKDSFTYIYQRDESALYQIAKLHVRYFGSLHRHKHRATNFVTLDIDSMNKSLYKEILDQVSMLPIFMITETSRGYHIILDLTNPDDAIIFYKRDENKEHNLMHKLTIKYKDLDIQRDSQEPIAGTYYSKENGKAYFIRIIQ